MDKEGTATASARTKRSEVWEHFTLSGDLAKCKKCPKTYKYFSSTTNLKDHLRNAHPELLSSLSSSEQPDKGKTKMGTLPISTWSTSTTKKGSCSATRAKEATEHLVDWISSSCRPLSIVDDPGLSDFVEFLEPGYHLPSRTHVSSLMKKRHAKGVDELIGIMAQSEYVALTSDAWTSRATQSYVTYTAHIIDESWHLQNFVLSTTKFDGSHTAANIAAHARETCRQFKLPTAKVVGLVHDEAANMMAAGRDLECGDGWANVPCGAHRLQTVVRHAVSGVREVETLLAACRRVVSHFHHSSKSTDELLKEQGRDVSLKLIQDCPTRWNSSYYMLERLLKLKIPVIAVLDRSEKREIRQLMIKDRHWELARDIVKILAPFENVTAVLGGQKYVTASLLLPLVQKLRKRCQQPASEDEPAAARRFRNALLQALEDKFDQGLEATLRKASALDPRFRSLKFVDAAEHDDLKRSILQEASRQLTEGDDDCSIETPAKKKPDCSKLAALMEDEDDGSTCASSAVEEDVQLYFSSKALPIDTDPLAWWSAHASEFPYLAVLARRYLCVPATSVPSERVFSCAGVIVNKLRASLSPSNVDCLIFLQKNELKSTRSVSNKSMSASTHQPQSLPKETVLEEELPPLPDLPDGAEEEEGNLSS